MMHSRYATGLTYFSGQKGYRNDKVVFWMEDGLHRGIVLSGSDGKFLILETDEHWERPALQDYESNTREVETKYVYKVH